MTPFPPNADGTKVSGSDVAFTSSGEAALEFGGPSGSAATTDFTVKVGRDCNGDSSLDISEHMPFVVRDNLGNVYRDYDEKEYEPVVRGINQPSYDDALELIDDIVNGGWGFPPDPAINYYLPHAKCFLQVFLEGEDTNVLLKKRPNGTTVDVPFTGFTGDYCEWLTHNSGLAFGGGTIKEYVWEDPCSTEELIGGAAEIRRAVTKCYLTKALPDVTTYFAALPPGNSATFPLDGSWYDVDYSHESPASWVPEYTVELHDCIPTTVDKTDDVHGSVARGRLLNHKAKFRVAKRLSEPGEYPTIIEEIVVEESRWAGTVADLYDFNFDAGEAAQAAAILQVGFGSGAYGSDRERGIIYRHAVRFDKTYGGLP